ncbi:hypothetical protein KJ644_00975 [Candidatus Dependentiae bacterium]|nr:hypothetical protein [Candidatus Dependentiae bacterium]MBU4387024.1 hypothetical protein [Candidatus Dependentiae bacterium]MCG2756105.1 hypothetical protein [Candidatus Dependentiae bacterium]
MKKILSIALLIIFHGQYISALLKYENLVDDKKKTFLNLIDFVSKNKLDDFNNLIGLGDNFTLTNVDEPNLAKSILKKVSFQSWRKKDDFLYPLITFSMLSEIGNQVEKGGAVPRFKKIKNNSKKKITKDSINSQETIINFMKNNKNGEETHFDWYFSNLIKKDKLSNPCFKKCVKWFSTLLKKHIENLRSNEISEVLTEAPYLVFNKIKEKDNKYELLDFVDNFKPNEEIVKKYKTKKALNEKIITFKIETKELILSIQNEINEKEPGSTKKVINKIRSFF